MHIIPKAASVVRARSLLAVCLFTLAAGNCRAGKPNPKTENLIDPKAFPAKWEHVSSDKKLKREAVWSLGKESDSKTPHYLICKAKQPSGYLRTKGTYDNYTLRLEFRYPSDPNCNSGILIHAGKDKIWPASIQVQLHRPFAGSIFPTRGAKSSNTVMRKEQKLGTGKWHELKVVCEDGNVEVWINDTSVGKVSGCEPTKGYIALQSEGFEIHFRKMTIVPKAKPVPVKNNKPDPKKADKKTVSICNGSSLFGTPRCPTTQLRSPYQPQSPYCLPCRTVTQPMTHWQYDWREQRYVQVRTFQRTYPVRQANTRTFVTQQGVVYYYPSEYDNCERSTDRRRKKRRRRRRKKDDDDDDDD